jgi:hypothetical protein
LAAVCCLCLARTAFACSCVVPNPVCQTFWNASAVFVGDVESIEDLPGEAVPTFPSSRRVHLRVREEFRGAYVDEVDVFTGRGGADCGYAFSVGASYLVFANPEPDKRLTTGICNRTKPLAEASADLAYLRALPTMRGTKASIFGMARLWDVDEGREARPQDAPFGGARITATGPAGNFTALTGPDGSFDIRVPVGEYDVTTDVPSGKYVEVWPSHVVLPDARACAQSGLALHSDGRVSGRVVDAQGLPVSGLTVEVGAEPAVNGALFMPRHSARTAADGTFMIAQMPPGAYAIGFNLTRYPGSPIDPRVLLSPKSGQEPPVLQLSAGARLNIGDVVVPPSSHLAHVSGMVRREDGTSPAGTTIYLETGPDGRTFALGPVVVDASGAFTFTVISGYSCHVMAEGPAIDPSSGLRRFIRTDAVVFAAARENPPVVLILKVPR